MVDDQFFWRLSIFHFISWTLHPGAFILSSANLCEFSILEDQIYSSIIPNAGEIMHLLHDDQHFYPVDACSTREKRLFLIISSYEDFYWSNNSTFRGVSTLASMVTVQIATKFIPELFCTFPLNWENPFFWLVLSPSLSTRSFRFFFLLF